MPSATVPPIVFALFAAVSPCALAQDAVDPVAKLIEAVDRGNATGSADRLGAVRGLGQLARGNTAAVRALGQLVADDDLRVRSAAAKALLELGPAAGSAVPGLIRALDGPAPEVAARVLESIGAFATDAVPALFGLLESDDPNTRQHAASAIRAIRGPHRRSRLP
jgi:HEAT repeat protein